MSVLSAQGLGKGRGREKRLDLDFAVNYLYLTLEPCMETAPTVTRGNPVHGVTDIYSM